MWYFVGGLAVGIVIGVIGIAILTGPREEEQEERLKAYKQGYRDALRKVRGMRCTR